MLLQWLNARRATATSGDRPPVQPENRFDSSRVEELLIQGDQYIAQRDYAQAITVYQRVLDLDPRDAGALNNLGALLCNLGRFKEAESYLRRAIDADPALPDAYNNLGYVLRSLGRFAQAEISIRRALEINPDEARFQNNLGHTLLLLGRTREAEDCFRAVLRDSPGDLDAVLGTANAAKTEGRFAEAEAIFWRVLQDNPMLSGPWASLASLRRMTPADSAWLKGAQEIAASGVAVTQEADLRFAIGKYWDDIGDFERAFQSYRDANELLKTIAGKYNRQARVGYVDDLIRVYTRQSVGQLRGAQLPGGTCASRRPVFVVGMPRSGTSLVEQIIASHPAATGAGELGFWTEVLLEHVSAIRKALLPESIRKKLAEAYLQNLAEHSADALRVVDKAPVNAEYLGFIHSVFPNARIIYMQRDPIDTCLSCYFQYLSPALSYTMDLSDLAHYYRQHHRLMAHWRAVLPPGTLLDVPYEELVVDQEGWTRRILDFLGLEWHPQCLEFHKTQRPVLTSSSWQVRQKIYRSSVERWRHYEKFIGPLLELKDLGSDATRSPAS